MPKKNIHPKLHKVTVQTVNSLTFETLTTKDHKNSTLNSEFDTNNLPWNKKGLGNVASRDASVKKYQSRRGAALGFASVLSDK